MVEEQNIIGRASEGNLKFAENNIANGDRGEYQDCVYFYYNGIFHYKNGDLEKAKDEFKKAIRCNNDFFEARYDLGLLYRNSSEFADAAECFAFCAEAEPDNFEALFNYAYVSEKLKNYDTAETYYIKSLEINPNSAEALYNLGNIYKDRRKWNEANSLFLKALEISPGNEKYHTNYGITLHYRGEFENAVASFKKALKINPKFSEAKLNLAATFVELGKIENALVLYDELLSLNPNDSVAHYNKALALLLVKDYENGFNEYEWRLQSEYYSTKYDTVNFWNGEPLEGKTLLVIDEQGYGDFFQFIRYLKILKNSGGKIVLAVRPELKNFAGEQNFTDEVIALNEFVSADYKVFLLSLPKLLGVVEAETPYLTINQTNNLTDQKRIGIVWRGNSEHMYDFKRSIPLDKFLRSLKSENYQFVSLQYDLTDEEKELLEVENVEIPAKDAIEFADGVSALGNLDLIITVDTAIAHFAAAAGKSVWLLLPQIPDWRWGLAGDKTEWYATVKLFRQKERDDWESVLSEVKGKLSESKKNVNIELSVKKIEALEAIEKGEIDKGLNVLHSLEKTNPDDFDVNFWIGYAYNAKKENKKAIEYFLKAADIRHEDYNVKNLIGICEMEAENFPEAENYFISVPDELRSADIWNNLGFVLQQQRKLEQAEKCFFRAIEMNPSLAGYYVNLGNNYFYAHRFDEALKTFDKALKLEKDSRAAHIGRSFVYLIQKDFENGFEEFEWTLDKYENLMPKNSVKWNGENGEGKFIFIYGEQGLGDVIQFARFLPKVKSLGFKIIFDCDKNVKPLFINRDYIDELKNGLLIEADYFSSLLSLPKVLGIKNENEFTLTQNLFYVDPEKKKTWRNKIDENKFNVGIVWKTNPKNKTAAERSIPVENLEELFNQKNVEFYSLQKELTKTEAEFLQKFENVTSLSEALNDFGDTAAIVENLDLVITVDTSTTHIAGSLGKKTWLIPSAVSEWRWGFYGENSYWYPTVKIFRPEKPFEWKDAIGKVADELKRVSSEKMNHSKDGKSKLNLDYAKSLLDEGKINDAISEFNKLIAEDENNSEAYFYLGYAHQISDNLEEAAQSYSNALRIKPEYFNALNNIGVVLKDMGKFDDAEKFLTFAKTVNPNNASVYNNLGIVFDLKGKYDEAIIQFNKALELRFNYIDATLNLANVLQTLGKYDEALELFDKIIETEPNHVGANFNKALTLLSKGDYKKGFELYEWRTKRDDFINREFSKPRLNTFDVKGKTIFVYDEQGFGDTIQFGRFIKPLAEAGADVILQCHNSLVDLMRGCKGVKEAIHRYSYNEPPIEYDYHIPLLSLPAYFGVELNTLPAETPYLKIDANRVERFAKEIGKADGLKIGIVWKGKTPVGNAHRSCSAEHFAELAKKNPAVRFYSLQVGASETDKKIITDAGIVDLSEKIETFLDTAAIIENMDLIITIDTSVAHLAGALNAKTYTLLSFKNDWRWKPETEDSAWYPSMKLIRQKTFGDWKQVFEKINFLLIDFEKDFVNS